MSRLEAHFAGRIGGFDLDAAFTAPDAGVTALFGPSGCGKTTVLRCIAGLERLRYGHFSLSPEEAWQDEGLFLPPHRRAVGYVFQEASLFPHLSVTGNLRYGQRRGKGGGVAFDEVVDLLGLAHLVDRAPSRLSGGERQRVAIGRALLSQPRLLLMDEPLSALDRVSKDEILPYLERLHDALSIPMIYVSHDIAEVERLADHLVLMRDGRVAASGPLSTLLADPALPFAAGRDAAVVLDAAVAAWDAAYGLTRLTVAGAEILVPGAAGALGTRRRLRIAAGDVSLCRVAPQRTSILNVLPARVLALLPGEAHQVGVLARPRRRGRRRPPDRPRQRQVRRHPRPRPRRHPLRPNQGHRTRRRPKMKAPATRKEPAITDRMIILGLSDGAAALLRDGDLIAAAQEERFTRRRNDSSFPARAIRACLETAGLRATEVDAVACCAESAARDAVAETLTAFDPRIDWNNKLISADRHRSLAANAFLPSPFPEAAVLTLDGATEGTTTSLSVGRGNALETLWEIDAPDSLGRLYSAFTHYTGFKANSGEYKMMGLAPYGEPVFTRRILDRLVSVDADGGFRLNPEYFGDGADPVAAGAGLEDVFGPPPRPPEAKLTRIYRDLAASIQAATEDIVLRLSRAARRETGLPCLCLGGTVALNCVANGKVLRDGRFDDIWIPPAPDTVGGAVGAAFAAYRGARARRHLAAGNDGMHGAYLGPGFAQADIEARLRAAGARFTVLGDAALYEACAEELADGQTLGWFQGRMEFGPRALGNRSILGDPRSPAMRTMLNLTIKYREPFRPFAPSVLRENTSAWFDLERDSPYMTLVAAVAATVRGQVPAITHIDGSARVQTVDARTNPRYHALISAFNRRTGYPVVVNTSFNIRGEPIVATPEEAFRCFMGTDIEALAVGNCFLRKAEQDQGLAVDYRRTVEPD